MKNSMQSLLKVVALYDVFLVDIWGVIYNGCDLYPDILDVFEYLKEQNKRVILLSNSAKQGGNVSSDLAKLGLETSLYEKIYTAGDSFLYAFSRRLGSATRKWYVLDHRNISNVGQLMDSYGYNITSTYEDADNVIIASINEEDLELKSYTAFVDFCKKSRPNIYSINPDLHVITPKGRLARPGLLTKSL